MNRIFKVLAIESSCDDTGAAVLKGRSVCSNVVSSQTVHGEFGGVVPELASRAHVQNIVAVVDLALKQAKIRPAEIDAVAFTRGPGLLGSLLVGASFARSFASALGKPSFGIHHIKAHVLAHHIEGVHVQPPEFPYLALVVSGGHTQLLKVHDFELFEILGQTLDDAAGEAFDKTAKILGLPYPGGPLLDRLAEEGNPEAFRFAKTRTDGLNFSFSGFKTSVLYTLRPLIEKDPAFVQNHLADLCASIRKNICDSLVERTLEASAMTGLKTVALSGGVAANRLLRKELAAALEEHGARLLVPPLAYCTDNAAMIGIAAVLRLESGKTERTFADSLIKPRIPIDEPESSAQAQ